MNLASSLAGDCTFLRSPNPRTDQEEAGQLEDALKREMGITVYFTFFPVVNTMGIYQDRFFITCKFTVSRSHLTQYAPG
jgi:hypothetical protein